MSRLFRCRTLRLAGDRLGYLIYADAVQRYLDIFGPRQVKVLIFEEFIRDTGAAVRDVLKFLGVEAEPSTALGEGYEARRFLEELYRNDVRRLEKILGRSLPWAPLKGSSA